MKTKLDCILLVDDDDDDNYFHQIIINEMNITNKIDVVTNGLEALEYLKRPNQKPPEIIFLDINMPKMNGWEFLEHYKNLTPEHRANVLVMILTTSANLNDLNKAKKLQLVKGFTTKPLTEEMLRDLIQEHFKEHL